MQEHEFFAPRHKLPRPDCIEAGYDYPHEGWGLTILVSERDCPACAPRALLKHKLIMEQEVLHQQIVANELKEQELLLRETGRYSYSAPRKTYVMPPPEQPAKGGQFVAPIRPNTSE